MGDKVNLTLDERELHGKKVAKLRKEGLVPAVVYGPGIEPISVQIEDRIMAKAYKRAGTYTPVHLTIGTKKKIAMIKDVDRDPVKGTIRHVSFHAVKASDPVIAEVPIQLVGEGESEAERAGLIILQNIEKIQVKALPMDLPDSVEISILGLKEAGDKVTLAEAKLPADVEFVEHESNHGDDEEQHSVTDLMVASAWEPSALAAANDAAAGDAEDESEVEAENGEAEEAVEGEEGEKDKDAKQEKSE